MTKQIVPYSRVPLFNRQYDRRTRTTDSRIVNRDTAIMLGNDFTANGKTETAASGFKSHVRLKGFLKHSLRVAGTTVTDFHLQPLPTSLRHKPGADVDFRMLFFGHSLTGIDNKIVKQLANLPAVG